MDGDHDALDYMPGSRDTPATGRTNDGPLRFVADCMLGKLAKWLRILGYDTRYDPDAPDEEIVRLAAREGRVILTRDSRLVLRRLARRHLLIRSDDPAEQLRQVIRELGIPVEGGRLLSRCLPCNVPTLAVGTDEVAGKVPPYVHRTQSAFTRCPSCGRIYWGATHSEDIRKRLEAMLGRFPI